MRTDPLDPPRLEDIGSRAEREVMRRRRLGPSDEALKRISGRLVAAGITGAAPTGTRAATTKAASSKLLGVALLVAGGLVLTWRAVHVPTPPVNDPAGGPGNVAAESTPAKAPDPLPPAVAAPATLSVNELPSAIPTTATASSPPSSDIGARNETPPKAATTARPSAPSATELELVQRAEAALASDPVRALTIATEHARAFPSGEFFEEREVIAVDALARLGRKAEASRRAQALVQRFPQTPYAVRLELAVGQPLTSTPSAATRAPPASP